MLHRIGVVAGAITDLDSHGMVAAAKRFVRRELQASLRDAGLGSYVLVIKMETCR